MDITRIHAASYGANVGQAAAAQLASLLFALEGDAPLDPVQNWFEASPGLPSNYTGDVDEDLVVLIVDELGAYVCQHQVEQGERLFRWAVGTKLIQGRSWDGLSIEQRLPWETFVGTCRMAHNQLGAAQAGIVAARRSATPAAQATMKREDSIFEDVDDGGALHPHAVEAGGLYQRAREAEAVRLENAAWDAMRDEAEADNRDWDKAHRKPAPRKSRPRPAPMSVGETPVARPANRGGRGNKKTA